MTDREAATLLRKFVYGSDDSNDTSPEFIAAIQYAIDTLDRTAPRLLSKAEAQELKKPHTLVWLEVSGGYDKCRYKPETALIVLNDKDGLHFFGRSGYSWDSYNRGLCGWRLWTGEPTDEERLGAEWEAEKWQ